MGFSSRTPSTGRLEPENISPRERLRDGDVLDNSRAQGDGREGEEEEEEEGGEVAEGAGAVLVGDRRVLAIVVIAVRWEGGGVSRGEEGLGGSREFGQRQKRGVRARAERESKVARASERMGDWKMGGGEREGGRRGRREGGEGADGKGEKGTTWVWTSSVAPMENQGRTRGADGRRRWSPASSTPTMGARPWNLGMKSGAPRSPPKERPGCGPPLRF